MLVPWAALNGCHTTTAQCVNGVDHKRRRLVAEEMRPSTARAFQAYVIPLDLITSFKYLVQITIAPDDDL